MEKAGIVNPWQIRCGHCGRFCIPVDEYTIWGAASYDPPEPYDPTPVCAACLPAFEASLTKFVRAHGIPPLEGRPYWQSPDAWARVKALHKSLRRQGLWTPPETHRQARIERRGGLEVWSCGECGRPEAHPSHDTREASRVGVRRCWKFRRSVGRWIIPVDVAIWCVCGWSTGWWRLDRAAEASRSLPEPLPWWARGRGDGHAYLKHLLDQHCVQGLAEVQVAA